MAASSRLRWTLTGLALVALAGAVLWASLRGQGGSDAGPEERAAPTTPEGASLEGRAATESIKDPRTAMRSDGPRATLRFLAPDGRAAAGAQVTYVAFDARADALRGTADGDGVLALAAAVAGKQCHVMIAPGSSWAAGSFDVRALGEVTLRLESGCAVWFELAPSDADRLGQVLRYVSSSARSFSSGSLFDPLGRELSTTITSNRTFLGRFSGDFVVYALGTTRPGAAVSAVWLPPSGEVTLRWAARPAPRATAWLRVRGPAGSMAAPGVTVTGGAAGTSPWEVVARREEPGSVVLGGAPGRVKLLAAAHGQWAFSMLDASAGAEPVGVDLVWTRGCSLEVRLPGEPKSEPVLSVIRLPAGELDRGEAEYDANPTPGRIVFGGQEKFFPAGAWPQPPRVIDGTTRVWDGLPHGATVYVLVATERGGVLHATATIPMEGDSALLDVAPGATFTVRAVAEGPDPDVWLHARTMDSSRATEKTTRTVGSTAVVTGLAPGARVFLRMRDERFTGETTVTVSDGLEVRIPLVRRPTARYRARVVDEEGRPLAGVGVSFGAHSHDGTPALTDADGWAEAETASDTDVRAWTAQPDLTSQPVTAPPGEAVTVVAQRLRSVQVIFDVGDQVVTVHEEHGHMSLSLPRRVFSGSSYTLHARPDTTHVHLRVTAGASGAESVLFDAEVELEDVPTTLRVTR